MGLRGCARLVDRYPGETVAVLCSGHRRYETFDLPERLGSFGFVEDSAQIVAAFESGFALYAPQTGTLDWIARPPHAAKNIRFNDGRVDRQGRFWAGSMVEGDGEPRGKLYRLDGNGRYEICAANIAISNSICFSPDGKSMYFADTPKQVIHRYTLDPESGELSSRRIFAIHAQGRLSRRRAGGLRRLRVERALGRQPSRAVHTGWPRRYHHRSSGDAADLRRVRWRRHGSSVRDVCAGKSQRQRSRTAAAGWQPIRLSGCRERNERCALRSAVSQAPSNLAWAAITASYGSRVGKKSLDAKWKALGLWETVLAPGRDSGPVRAGKHARRRGRDRKWGRIHRIARAIRASFADIGKTAGSTGRIGGARSRMQTGLCSGLPE